MYIGSNPQTKNGDRMRTFGVFLVVVSTAISAIADDATKVVVASDKKTQIAVPSTWSPLKINEAAEIQVGNEDDEAYLIVLNELKADLAGWNLDKHSRVTLGQLLTDIASPSITGPKSLTINNSPAVQYEIRGAAENRNIVYIHTTVDGPKYFSQILAWTLPSRVETVRPQLLRAITTFREVE
jgi:hypothetical protein